MTEIQREHADYVRGPEPMPYGSPEPLPGYVVDGGGQPTAVLRLTARGSLYGQAVYFAWDFGQVTQGQNPAQNPVPVQLQTDLVNAYAAAVLTPLLANSVSAYTIVDVTSLQISTYNVAALVVTPTGYPKSGTVSGEALPQNECYVVSKYTNWRGRRGRGRVYIAGVPIGSVTAGRLTATYFTSINSNVWSKVGVGFTLGGGTWSPCVTRGRVIRTQQNPPLFESGVRGNWLSNYKIQLDMRTQRRRNYGRGI